MCGFFANNYAVYTPGVSEHRSTGSLFYANDALGSPRFMVNASGTMTDDERFDAFGMTVFHGGASPTTTPYGFVGKKGYQTDTSGLMLLGHRYYDAGIGRFLSRDPIHDGSNWYAYCGNNPLDKADPSGEGPEEIEEASQALPPPARAAIGVGIIIYGAAQAVVDYFHNNPLPTFNPTWTPPTAHPIPVSRTGPVRSPVAMTKKGQIQREKLTLDQQKEKLRTMQREAGATEHDMKQGHRSGTSTRNGSSDEDITEAAKTRKQARDKEREENPDYDQDKDEWGKWRRGKKG